VSSDTERYGPQTEQIEDLLGRLEAATGEQLQQIGVVGGGAACDAATDAVAAYDADVYVDAAYVATYDVAVDVADGDVYGDTYADAVADAAYALAIRHLISEDGFTWEHYRTLTDPVAFVLGALHPED
jgi:hypothetical protein